MTDIEDRLWEQLVREPGAELALAVQRPLARSRVSRQASITAGGALAVTIGVIVAMLFLTAGTKTTPAYAVIQNADGSVTLTLNELLGVSAANEQLARLGVRATVAKVEASCTATGEAVPFPASTLSPQKQIVETEKRTEGLSGLAWIIRPNAIPAGDTVLIAVQPANGGNPVTTVNGRAVSAISGTIGLYHGNAPTCRASVESLPAEK
jgi:hypothetical protein